MQHLVWGKIIFADNCAHTEIPLHNFGLIYNNSMV